MLNLQAPLLEEKESSLNCIGRNAGGTFGLIALSAVLFGPGIAASLIAKSAVPFFGIFALELYCFSPGLSETYSTLFSCVGPRRTLEQNQADVDLEAANQTSNRNSL